MLKVTLSFLVATMLLAHEVSADVIPLLVEKAQEESQSPLLVARDLMQAGKMADAEEVILAHLEQHPDDTSAMLLLAEVLFRMDDLDAAASRIRRVIQLEPENALAHRGLARYHFLNQDYDSTLQSLQRALELDPTLFAAQIDLADYYLMVATDIPAAIAAYRAAIQLNPDHGGAHNGLATAYARAGNYAAAEDTWRHTATLEPTNPLPLFYLGNSLLARGEESEAFAAYTQALDANSTHIDSLLARGRLYASRGEFDRALGDFDRILAIAPDNPVANLNVALVEHQRGNDAAAIDAYRLTLAANDGQPRAHNNLAWLLAKTPDNLDEALRHAQRATELNPQIGPFWDTLGWIQHLMGDNEVAKQSLERAVSLHKEQAEAYEHLAKVHIALGDDAAAADAERMAQSLRAN